MLSDDNTYKLTQTNAKNRNEQGNYVTFPL